MKDPSPGRWHWPALSAALRRDLRRAVELGALVGALSWAAKAIDPALLITSFASSGAVVFGAPHSSPARPRAVLVGHVCGAVCGLAAAALLSPSPPGVAVAVVAATLLMSWFDVFHPPAAANAVLAFTYTAEPLAFLAAVVAGAATLALTAAALRRRAQPAVRNVASASARGTRP